MSFTYVSKELIKEEIGRFKSIRPDNAEIVITSAQKGFFGFLFALGLFLGMVHFMEIFIALVGTCVVVFSILFSMKSLLTFVSLKKGLLEITKEELEGLKDEDLPVYTVLIPLRGEASVFHQLVDHLSAIDYPVEKLQVLILLEENDPSTVAAAKSIKLPSNFEVLVLADEGPRTKPKACTLALKYARGEFIVVYDAEDEMEPDQLKKVICAYQNLPEKVWCIQAKLEYHNHSQNLLTKLFAGEYATYFNMLLPALGSLDLLVPLGGTSNHFKAEKLKKMGSWDPFNVTEDLDLGIVIKRSGGLVKVINSVTWEEANARLGIVKKGGWIPQRSRWIKGHMQAYLTHMRNPFKLLRDLGIKNFLVFQLIVGGTPAALLLSPVFLMVTVFYTLVRSFLAPVNPEVAHIIQIGIESIFPPAIFYLGMIVFILGNFMLVYYLLIGCLIRELYSNVKWMILAPLYWLLMSIATWKAFWQMFTKPHYWEKSEHGPVNKVQEVHTSIVVQPVLVEE